MTTPQQNRQPLAEIPYRFEQLRVATTPTAIRIGVPNEPTPANTSLNNSLDDSIISATSDISLSYMSPITSPEMNYFTSASSSSSVIFGYIAGSTEMADIIPRNHVRRFTRSAGYRSPDKYSKVGGSAQKTPTKSTTMTLRSSPRKRMLKPLDFYTPEKNKICSPLKNITDANVSIGKSPLNKRFRLEEKSIAQTNSDVPINIMLKGLSHDQLIEMITKISNKNPSIEEQIRSEFPIPDINPLELQLKNTQKNIFKSLPSSRLLKKTDSIAYGRAQIHLRSFKKCLAEQSRTLYESKHWDGLLDYVLMAWSYVRDTPIWDNQPHNTVRKQCFKILLCHCVAALRHGGIKLGQQRLQILEKELQTMSKDYEDIFLCTKYLQPLLGRF